MAIKSISVDFEHKVIIVRPEGAPERRIAVNQLYPELFKAEMNRVELPAGSVDAEIKAKEDNINKSLLSAEQKQAALSALKSSESVERIRRGLTVQAAKSTARTQAEEIVDSFLAAFAETLKVKNIT